jgi:hypothetical protein
LSLDAKLANDQDNPDLSNSRHAGRSAWRKQPVGQHVFNTGSPMQRLTILMIFTLPAIVAGADKPSPRIERARDAKLDKEFDYLIYDLGKGVELKLVKVAAKGKTFTIGSPKEEKDRRNDEEQRDITLTDDYYIGRSHVTRG